MKSGTGSGERKAAGRKFGHLLLIIALMALPGCSSGKEQPPVPVPVPVPLPPPEPPAPPPPAPPPPPPPTSLDLTIRGAPDLNPSPSGRPSPVIVEVYQLASPSAFAQADFFDLEERQASVLGADMIARKAFPLLPGTEERMAEILPPPVTHVGIMAAYRDIENVTWRTLIAVPKNVTTTVTIEAGARGLVTAATSKGQP